MRKYIILIFFLFITVFAKGQIAVFPSDGSLYDGNLHTIKIIINPDTLDALLDPTNRWNNRVFPANMVYDNADTVFNVGIRIKGNSSRNAKKLSFKITTDEYSNQTYQGLKTFNLNGEHNDPSLIREYIACYVMEKSNNLATRANMVKLYFNNVYFGVYGNIEHVNKKFVESRLGDNLGNLYKCSWPADLKYISENQNDYKALINPSPLNERAYELKTNETLDDYSDLVNFIKVINNTPVDSFQQKIEKVFEVNKYLRTLATEILIGHWDNYFMNKNNYYLYHNLSTGKFNYIPYDMDNTLGVQWGYSNIDVRNINNWGNIGASSAPLTYKILAIPEYKNYFNKQIRALCDSIFNTSLYTEIDRIKSILDPAVQTDSFYAENWESDYGYNYLDWLSSFNNSLGNHASIGLKPYIQNRWSSARSQLQITNISLNKNNGIDLYPNPSSGIVYISTSTNSIEKITIYNTQSQIVFRSDLSNNKTNSIDLSKLETGVYFVQIEEHEGSKSIKKLVIRP